MKNKLLIPGVSSEAELASYDKQIEKYVERFGAGAVVWATKNAPHTGFCQTIQRRHAGVVHFNVAQTGGSGNHKPKKKKRVPKADRSCRPHNSTLASGGSHGVSSDDKEKRSSMLTTLSPSPVLGRAASIESMFSFPGFGVDPRSPITITSSLDASRCLTHASLSGHRLGDAATPTTTPPASGMVDADSLQRQRATQRTQRAAAAESRLKGTAG